MQLFPSAERAVATYTKDFQCPDGAKGVRMDVNYTAEEGAGSTLDFKLQYHDGDAYKDLTGASLVQLGAVGDIDLMVHNDVTAVANRIVKLPLPKQLRAVAAVGTTKVTFSVNADFLY